MNDDIVYLGDGLYAYFENMQIILMANDRKNPTDVVYIEWPDVWNALKTFVENELSEFGETEGIEDTDAVILGGRYS